MSKEQSKDNPTSKIKRDVLILIPAFNEAEVIAQTIEAIPSEFDIMVINNGSTDQTASIVRQTRARIVEENRKGYGQAVYTGILEGIRLGYRVGVIYDADAANDPQDIHKVIEPIYKQEYDLCIAQRTKYAQEGSLTPVQKFGNQLSTFLIKHITGYSFSDMGSMRAFSLQNLKDLELEDRGFGWNIEMQIKAVRKDWRILELDLPYRRRSGGESKISGNRRAAIHAGWVILTTAFRYAR